MMRVPCVYSICVCVCVRALMCVCSFACVYMCTRDDTRTGGWTHTILETQTPSPPTSADASLVQPVQPSRREDSATALKGLPRPKTLLIHTHSSHIVLTHTHTNLHTLTLLIYTLTHSSHTQSFHSHSHPYPPTRTHTHLSQAQTHTPLSPDQLFIIARSSLETV